MARHQLWVTPCKNKQLSVTLEESTCIWSIYIPHSEACVRLWCRLACGWVSANMLVCVFMHKCVCPAFQPCATEPAISQCISRCAAVSCWWGTLNNVISPLLFEIKASISWTSAPSPPSQWPSPPARTLSATYSVHNKDAMHWQTTLDVKQSQSIACFLCENTISYGLPLKR